MSQQPVLPSHGSEKVDQITVSYEPNNAVGKPESPQPSVVRQQENGNVQSTPPLETSGAAHVNGVPLTSGDHQSPFRGFFPVKRFTMLPDAHVEPRPFEHKYVFMRPRLLQYSDNGWLVDAEGRRLQPMHEEDLVRDRSQGEGTARVDLRESNSSHHSIDQQRTWLVLFIDLLWVGIVSNISRRFSDTAFEEDNSWGLAFLEFCVMFLTAWKIWEYLAKFLNNFFRKDFLQSVFLMWILVLALLFGNNAPYFLDDTNGNVVIYLYLAARGTFTVAEIYFCFFIPELRQEFKITAITLLPTIGLWTGSFWVPWPAKGAVILTSIGLETAALVFITSPASNFFLHGKRKALDVGHYTERLQGFFIIILGEGVVDLIQASPLGPGLTLHAYYGIVALIIYYELYWLFFTGDHTKTFLHAVFRNHYTRLLFYSVHIPLFGSLLLLDASISYLIETIDLEPSDAVAYSQSVAQWTISGNMAAVLIFLTLRTLLNRSFDEPGTLMINNRYLRMLPRMTVMIIILCMPIFYNYGTGSFLATIMGMMQLVMFFEYVAGMEKGAKLFEPRNAE